MQEINQVDFSDCSDPIAAVHAYWEKIIGLCVITDDDVEIELWATDEGNGRADAGAHAEDLSLDDYSLVWDTLIEIEMEVRRAMGCS